MDIVNNRYRVIKCTNQDYIVSEYTAYDMLMGGKMISVNLINPQYAEALTDEFLNDFIVYSSLNSSLVLKDETFDTISVIDNKKKKERDYFYTFEYFDNNSDIFGLTKNMSNEDILNVFMNICGALGYLHKRGILYGAINPDNILINISDGNYSLKLRDIASIRLREKNWETTAKQYFYIAPEMFSENNKTIQSDIYSLGIMAFMLYYRNAPGGLIMNNGSTPVDEKLIHSYQLNCGDEFIEKLCKIIRKMVDPNPYNRQRSIDDVVKDINTAFIKKYNIYNISELESLNFYTRINGRDEELNAVLKEYELMKQSETGGKLVAVHGESGIGKTRFLKELMYRLHMKKANVYGSFNMDGNVSRSYIAYIDILKKMISNCGEDLIEKYRPELAAVIPELQRDDPGSSYIYSIEKDKSRIMNKLYNFIVELIEDTPLVIIVDDVHMSDDSFVEFMELLYSRISNNNILYIISYNDNDAKLNSKFERFVTKIKNKKHVLDIVLRELDYESTALMVRNILGIGYTPKDFSARIYSASYGNPLFTQEILKNLYLKGCLFVNENDGDWDTEYKDDYDSIMMPESMESAVINQLKNIKEMDYKVLEVVSIFNSAVPIEILKGFFDNADSEIEKSIDDLIAQGFLVREIADWGYVYDFRNRFLKRFIYAKQDEDDKTKMHQKASVLLKDYVDNVTGDSEELIYHLEKSHNWEMLIKYCLENAGKMEALRNREEAIKSLKRAYRAFPPELDDIRKAQIMIRIGDNYSYNVDKKLCIEYYKKAERIPALANDKLLHIDCLNKIANEYCDMNELGRVEKYLDKIFKLLGEIDYPAGYAMAQYILSKVYLIKRDNDNAYEAAKKGISICPKSSYELLGTLNNIMGLVLSDNSSWDDALSYLKKSYQDNVNANNINGILSNLNNIGMVYSEHFNQSEKAEEYFNRMKEMAHANGYIHHEALALSNLSLEYYYRLEYGRAQEAMEKSVAMAPENYYDSGTLFGYNVLCRISLKLGNYRRAWECYEYSQKALKASPDQGRDISMYYMACADLYYELGNMDSAEKCILNALNVLGKNENRDSIDCKVSHEFISIYKKGGINIEENINDIILLSGMYSNYDNKADVLCDLCILLIDFNCNETAKKLIKSELKQINSVSCQLVRLKADYINAIMAPKKRRVRAIEEAISLARELKEKPLLWKLCCRMGDIYYSKRNYFYAINYYFEACEVVKDMIIQFPEDKRIDYIYGKGYIEPFNKLKSFLNGDKDLNHGYDIRNLTDLENILKYNDFLSILSNKVFIKSANRIYSKSMPGNIHSIKDVIANISMDEIESLELIIKYISGCALATRGLIILERPDGSRECIAANCADNRLPENMYIIDKARMTRKPVLLNSIKSEGKSFDRRFLDEGIKAAICVPVLADYSHHTVYAGASPDAEGNMSSQIKGYIYLESERILNNFYEQTIETCELIAKLTGILIEKYELNMSLSKDKLTGTYSRKYLEDHLKMQIEISKSSGGIFSILMFDLDNFKSINDRFGHQTGDKVLKKLCEIVMSDIDNNQVCGRYGGEEFIIIMPGIGAEEAFNKAEKIRNKIDLRKIWGDRCNVTVSIGIASYPIHGYTSEELIEKADQALYMAKNSGRNKCCIWDKKFVSRTGVINKLSGIISGNTVQDQRNVEVIIELLELVKSDMPFEDKLFNSLGRIIEITEAQEGMILINSKDGSTKKYGRKAFSEKWADVKGCSDKIIEDVIQKHQGVYMIDWDEIPSYDSVTGVLDWHSIIVVPLVHSGIQKGILYLSSPMRQREFKSSDYNYVSTLAGLLAAIE